MKRQKEIKQEMSSAVGDDSNNDDVATCGDPTTTTIAPAKKDKCVFYDMTHSNNSARIRLWLQLKGIPSDVVEIKLVTMADLRSPNYSKINPHKKVPAFITDTGICLFEASVIMLYLEDKFVRCNEFEQPQLFPTNADDRAICNLITRCHDIYIASPNCTQPNFAHTQGCMYLDPIETKFTPKRRCMDAMTRAAKLAEIYNQLTWLNSTAKFQPYLVGQTLTHADLTWFPTMVFMEFMLPKSFGWSNTLLVSDVKVFPNLTVWYQHCINAVPEFSKVRQDILQIHQEDYDNGRLFGVIDDVQSHPEYKWKYM